MSMIEYFTFYDKSGTPYIFQVYPSIGGGFSLAFRCLHVHKESEKPAARNDNPLC